MIDGLNGFRSKILAVTRAARARTRTRLAGFGGDEAGTLVVFGLTIFILMLAAAGMAIDVMRYENMRTRLQGTLDRSVLAAASLEQTLDPVDVVEDYFEKSDLDDYTLNVEVDEGLNFRSVSATVSATVNSLFLNMVGIDSLQATAASTAEERIQKVEISMVVDISGSMGSYSRLTNLKTAAKEFVETLLSASDPGNISISIVPYSGVVNVGSVLIGEYNVSAEHSYSNCVRFDDEDFNEVALSPAQSLERLAHFEMSWEWDHPIEEPWCPTSDDLSILALSMNEADLDDRIDDLVADGNTAADLGMKWGVALLDPGTQPVISNLVTAGEIDALLDGRPASYDDGETLKVVILMTDGQNTTQYDIKQDFKSGNSNVWVDTDSGKYSVYVPDYDSYYVPDDEDWQDTPYGNYEETTCTGKKKNKVCTTVVVENAVNLTYPELWNTWAVYRHADYFYRDFSYSLYVDWYYSREAIVYGSQADDRLLDVCDAAKDEGIVVFTIGFEAPSSGQQIMEDCASSSAHYYDVDGLEISDAFSAIAASIQRLKLVQ